LTLIQHTNDRVRYEQQAENSKEYVLPFIRTTQPITVGTSVLEIGCGEGGVLLPFIEAGCKCLGVDLNPARIVLAKDFLSKEIADGKVDFLVQNVYDDVFAERYKNTFDIIILKDVIEHVPGQEAFVPHIKSFLKAGGQIFFGFPPWYMPFGGHQQVCRRKWASVLPYYHILPRFIYKGILKLAGEDEPVIRELLEVKDTQITIERFERIMRKSGLKILNKQPYLINPIYRYKFGLKPRKQNALFYAIPYVRDFLTTCMYYTVG